MHSGFQDTGYEVVKDVDLCLEGKQGDLYDFLYLLSVESFWAVLKVRETRAELDNLPVFVSLC